MKIGAYVNTTGNYASTTVQVLPLLLHNGAPTGLYWNHPQMFNVISLATFGYKEGNT